jgi:hypothetical protein
VGFGFVYTILFTASVVQEGGPTANGLQPSSTAPENDYGKALTEAAKATAAQGVNNAYHGSIGTQDPYRAAGDVRAAEEWATHEAPNGKPFYHNLLTGTTQWEKPSALEAQNHAQVRAGFVFLLLLEMSLTLQVLNHEVLGPLYMTGQGQFGALTCLNP